MWKKSNAHVSKEKDEVSSSQFPVLCSSLGETVGQSKTIVGEPDDDVSEVEELDEILQGLRVAQAAVTERWPSRKIARK